jgi:hypothetical protein
MMAFLEFFTRVQVFFAMTSAWFVRDRIPIFGIVGYHVAAQA